MIAIEPTGRLIVRLAAGRLHGGSVPKGTAELARELRSFLNDDNGLYQLPQRQHFYDVLIGIGNNTQLSSVFPTMRLHLLRAQCAPFLTKVHLEKHRQGYSRIASAVLSGNAKAAEKAMIAHNRATQLALEAMPALAFPTENT